MNMNNARSERLAMLLARGLSRIRKREGANWAVATQDRDLPDDAPELQDNNGLLPPKQEDRNDS